MKFTPLRISLLYFSFALIWVTTSDFFIDLWFEDPMLLSVLQTLKGFFFVSITAILLYGMMNSYKRFINKNNEELENQKKRLDIALETANMATWEYVADQDSFIATKNHNKMFGYTDDESLVIQKILDRIYYKDLKTFEKRVAVSLEKGEAFDHQYRVQLPGGRIRWYWTKAEAAATDNNNKFSGITVDITDRKVLEEELQIERERLSKLFNRIPVLINMYNSEIEVISINNHHKDILGWTLEEIKERSLFELCYPDPSYRKMVISDIQTWEKGWKEYRVTTKSGEERLQMWTNIQLSDDTFVGVGYDVTEQRKLEYQVKEERERLQMTTISANVGLWEWNPQTDEVYIDEIWAALVGYTLEELAPVSIETWNKLVQPEDLELFNRTVEKYFNGETDSYECEVRMKHKNGHWVWILDRGKIVERDKNGNPVKMAGTHVDISDRVHAEQENKMLANVYRFSNTALGVSDHKTGKIMRVNTAFAELLDYKVEELVGKKVEEIYAPEFQNDIERAVKELTEYGQTIYETSLQKKSGETFQALINLALVTDVDNKTEYRLSTVQDISFIKEQQAELQRSRDRLLQAQEIAKLGYWTFIPEDNSLWLSEVVYDIYGRHVDRHNPTIDNYLKLTHPDDKSAVKEVFENELLNKRFESIHRIVRNGQTWHIQLRGERFFDENERKWMINGTVLDITEIKRIEEQLEAEQKRFEIAANITSDVIWEWDPQKSKLWWGDGIENILGYNISDCENDSKFWYNRISDKDRKRITRSMESAEKNGALYWHEKYSFLDVNDEERLIDDSAMLVRDKDGNIIRIIGAMVDKTKEIEYQRSLEHQSQRFEMIAKSSNDVLYERNCKTGEIWWSEGWLTKFMFDEDEVEQSYEWWKSHLHPDDRKKIVRALEKSIDKGSESWHEYYKFKNGKGEYSIVIDKGYFIREKDNVTYLVGTISDITEEVNAREELKASEEQYRLLFEQNPIPMWIYDPESLKFVTVNKSALEKYGYTKDEMLNMTIADIRPAEDVPKLKKDLAENLKKENSDFREWVHLTKDGKKLMVEVSASNIFYKRKRQRLVIAHDITEQRKAEEKAISAIIQGEERERQRIAKELHDGLGQYLSASNMNLKSVYEDLNDMPGKQERSFKTGLELLNHAISETRNISQNLLPKAIQDYGLELAVESLISNLRNSNNIRLSLYKNISEAIIPNNVQINLYRILQEALNNAIRHGNPDKIDVQLVYSDNELLIVVEDNGTGFNIKNENENGLGIRSMKTRAGAMSAEFNIASSKDKGTIITVIVPILNDSTIEEL